LSIVVPEAGIEPARAL